MALKIEDFKESFSFTVVDEHKVYYFIAERKELPDGRQILGYVKGNKLTEYSEAYLIEYNGNIVSNYLNLRTRFRGVFNLNIYNKVDVKRDTTAPRIHHLKTWPLPFTAIKEGLKTFDMRFNDRNYQVGDLLVLQEYLPTNGTYTGKEVERVITYIQQGDIYGLMPGFVCMSIEPVKK